MPPANQAAWLIAPCAYPLVVNPAPYTSPGPKQMVIKNACVAVNPLDWAKQYIGDKRWLWLSHPCILGADVAGEVVEVGSEISRFRVGDRIIAHALGFYEFGSGSIEGAFQLYTVVREHMSSPIPDSMTFQSACVIPLSCSAAASALFQKAFLALDYPTSPAAAPNGQILIVTGGATAVGSNAIQLAHSAGYQVATTCSQRSFDHVKRLGADFVFDYSSPTYEAELLETLRGRRVAGAFALGTGSVEACVHVLGQLGDACRKLVVKASFPWPKTLPKGHVEYWEFMKTVDVWNEMISEMEVRFGVETKFVEGAELARNEVSKVLYEDFLPRAMGDGSYIPAPEPMIVGSGLSYVQEALDRLRNGVSATKVVVSLEQER